MIGRSAADAGFTFAAALESLATEPPDAAGVSESARAGVGAAAVLDESASFASLDEHATRTAANSG